MIALPAHTRTQGAPTLKRQACNAQQALMNSAWIRHGWEAGWVGGDRRGGGGVERAEHANRKAHGTMHSACCSTAASTMQRQHGLSYSTHRTDRNHIKHICHTSSQQWCGSEAARLNQSQGTCVVFKKQTSCLAKLGVGTHAHDRCGQACWCPGWWSAQ